MMENFTYDHLVKAKGVQIAERLAYIDFLLFFKGGLSRVELFEFFGLKEAAASQAITEYRSIRAKNVEYDRRAAKNVILRYTYQPLITWDAEVALSMLASGFNKNKLKDEPLLPFARVGLRPKRLDVNIVSKVTRAISEKIGIKCHYLSGSGKHSERLLFPTAFFYDGNNWMFRAYHKDMNGNGGSFKCFDFSRVASVEELTALPASTNEKIEQDADWHITTPIHLELHPDLSEADKSRLRYEFDIDESTDSFVMNVKAVLFYYLVDLWKIDVQVSASNRVESFNFILKNGDMLQHLKCMENVFKA